MNTDVIRAAVARGESLPASWYTSQAMTEAEMQAIFRRHWQYVGPVSSLKAAGDYITASIGDVPVVIVRNDQGLAGFVNVCRHRRHEVMSGSGNTTLMHCPYHAWTYDLHGCLKAAPRAEREADFDPAKFPLLALRVETLGPLVFAHLEKDAPSLAQTYPGVGEHLAAAGLDFNALHCHERSTWSANVNWKLMLENYLECYHCPGQHPEYGTLLDLRPSHYHLAAEGHVLSQWSSLTRSLREGKGDFRFFDPHGPVTQSQFHLLWPSCTINVYPGLSNLSVDTWVGRGAGRTEGLSDTYFAEDAPADFIEGLTAFDALLTQQDMSLTDSVQVGSRSGLPAATCLLKNSESLLIHFQTLVVDALAAQGSHVIPISRG